MTKSPITTVISLEELEDRKRALAYQMWEDEGRPEGKAEAHWEQACLVVMSLGEGDAAASPLWLKRIARAVIRPRHWNCSVRASPFTPTTSRPASSSAAAISIFATSVSLDVPWQSMH